MKTKIQSALPTPHFALRTWVSLARNPQPSTLNSQLFAQGTAFTYQGRLNVGTNGANGVYDLRFALFDAVTPRARNRAIC